MTSLQACPKGSLEEGEPACCPGGSIPRSVDWVLPSLLKGPLPPDRPLPK